MIRTTARILLFILLDGLVLIALPFIALWQVVKFQPEIWRRVKSWTQPHKPKPDPISEACKEAVEELPACLGMVGPEPFDYVAVPQFSMWYGTKYGTD